MTKTKWTSIAVVLPLASTVLLALAACQSGTAPVLDAPQDEELALNRPSRFCGGIAGIPCPAGHACVDDPHDDCDPNNGGADCGGLCVTRHDDCDAPGRRYLARDPRPCSAIRFQCDAGEAPFFDDCGCGCEPVPRDPEPCGELDCPAGEVCCNASCSICVPRGDSCIQLACE